MREKKRKIDEKVKWPFRRLPLIFVNRLFSAFEDETTKFGCILNV
jgi:hypothetical protein